MAAIAKIIKEEIKNGIIVGLTLESTLDDNRVTHYYDLNTDDLAAVAADVSGTDEALKTIAVRECAVMCNALQAQKDAAAADVTTYEDTSIDISGMLILGGIALLGLIWFGIATVKAHHRGRISCSAFQTQVDAQKAFENGARYLDANHNGIACDNLIGK